MSNEQNTNAQPLSAEERAELEALRAEKQRQQEAARAAKQRAELEELRAQKAREEEYRKIAYEAAKERVEREKKEAKIDAMYDRGEIPPMPLKQKIILGILFCMVLVGLGYVIYSHFSG